MLTCDETKEIRVVLNKINESIIDLEYEISDCNGSGVIKECFETLKIVKASYMNFIEELAKAERIQHKAQHCRITKENWKNLDPWEMCGQDSYCTRDCHNEDGCLNGCIVPKLYVELAKREDMEQLKEQNK